MKGLKTFRKGGVHPRGNKEITSRFPIKNAHVPVTAVIPLSQHIGAPATSVVNVGDDVKEGMLIAKASGFVSANIHSPIPGKVKELKEIFLPQGIKTGAIVIEFAGEFDKSGKALSRQPWENLDGQTLNSQIADMGIVGLGGATFPTHVKYSVRDGQKIEHLIINGVECEPFLTADHRLMLEKPDEILEGVRIVQKIVQAPKVMIAVEANKPDAIKILSKKIQDQGLPYSVIPLRVKYPQGDEKMLLQAILKKQVPSGGLPLDIGAVVSNVGTVFAIYEAIVWQKPLVDRVMTVTGPGISRPSNVKARIGTKVGEIIEDCGGFRDEPGKVILGGPMMGFAIADLDTPVTKGVSGIIAFAKKQTTNFPNNPCIRCARCVRACPWSLMPTQLYKLIEYRDYEQALKQGLLDCKECGCCAYVCPARIPLVQSFKFGKMMSRKKQ